jgi:hypothetical protein
MIEEPKTSTAIGQPLSAAACGRVDARKAKIDAWWSTAEKRDGFLSARSTTSAASFQPNDEACRHLREHEPNASARRSTNERRDGQVIGRSTSPAASSQTNESRDSQVISRSTSPAASSQPHTVPYVRFAAGKANTTPLKLR